MKYNHAFTIAFEVESEHPEGEDVTQEMLAKALSLRILTLLQNKELVEAVGAPYDTYKVSL